MGKSLHWNVVIMILFIANIGIFPPSYAAIPSFISCFTTFYYLDPYFVLLTISSCVKCSCTGVSVEIGS